MGARGARIVNSPCRANLEGSKKELEAKKEKINKQGTKPNSFIPSSSH
jgi:hypothetical protein